MKKVIVLAIATCFAFAAHAEQKVTNTGKSYLRYESPFQSAEPMRVSEWTAPEFRGKHRADHNGDFQIVVFGGRNASQSTAAQYYFPATADGVITFNSSVTGDTTNLGGDTLQLYWNGAQDATFGANSITRATLNGTANKIGYVGTESGATVAGATGTPTAAAGIALVGTIGTNGSITTPAANALGYSTTVGGSPYPITDGEVLVINPGTLSSSQNQFAVQPDGVTTYLPYNLSGLRGLVDTDARIGVLNTSTAADNGFRIDSNRNTAVVRPWNFGIGYAPNVEMGAPVIQSTFVSTIAPELERSQWGIGATYKQILSDKDTGFWLELSTALQRVTMNMDLHEAIETPLVYGDATNWGDGSEGETFGYATSDITTVAEAFAQPNWLYGKIDGAQSVTRLADIELKLGYQFVCEDNVLSNGYVGMIIPTGNKATAEFMAEPIVGNGFHFGLMAGSTAEIQLNAGSETRWSSRSDVCYRYLFQNQQMRSFDTHNGNWSRYMYVWDTYANEQLNETDATPANAAIRAYTPGINVFTREVNVTPQAIIRYNQALILESGGFKGELGWNVLIRQDELVSLVTPWEEDRIVYADASNIAYSLYNADRTIYNDAYQSAPVPNLTADGSQALYNAASVKASDLNLNSAASWSTMVSTPYLALGYGFNEERSSIISIGGSYEFTASNDYINEWMLWGKFSLTF